jgi:hypothetical protein
MSEPYRPGLGLLWLALIALILAVLGSQPLLILVWMPVYALLGELLVRQSQALWAFVLYDGSRLVPDLHRTGLRAHDAWNSLEVSVSGWLRVQVRLEVSKLPIRLALEPNAAVPPELRPHELLLSDGVLQVVVRDWWITRSRAEQLVQATLALAASLRPPRQGQAPARPKISPFSSHRFGPGIVWGALITLGCPALALDLMVLVPWAILFLALGAWWASQHLLLRSFVRFEGSPLHPRSRNVVLSARDEHSGLELTFPGGQFAVCLELPSLPQGLELERGVGDGTGDASFDALLRAKGPPPELAGRLNSQARGALLALAALDLRDLKVSQGVLRVLVRYRWPSRERARTVVEAMLAVSDALRTDRDLASLLADTARHDPVAAVQRRALDLLIEQYPGSAGAVAREVLQTSAPIVWVRAAGYLDDRPRLWKALEDPDPWVAGLAAYALFLRLPVPDAVTLAQRLSQDSRVLVRQVLVQALTERVEPAFAPLVRARLQDPDESVRNLAAQKLHVYPGQA